MAAEFHEMQSDQSQVDDFTRDIAYLHPITDANPVLSDEEEIADDGYENALHGDGKTGGNEACEGHKRTQLAGKCKTHTHGHPAPQRDPAPQKKPNSAPPLPLPPPY